MASHFHQDLFNLCSTNNRCPLCEASYGPFGYLSGPGIHVLTNYSVLQQDLIYWGAQFNTLTAHEFSVLVKDIFTYTRSCLAELLCSFNANFWWALRCFCFIVQLRHLKADIKNSFQTSILVWQPVFPLKRKWVFQISLKTQLHEEQTCPSTSLQLSCL